MPTRSCTRSQTPFLGDKQNFNICRNSNDAPLCAGLEMSKVFGTMSYCHIWSALTWKWISKSKGRSSDHQVELERMVEPNCFTCQHHPAFNQGRGWITKIWREIPEHHHHHHHYQITKIWWLRAFSSSSSGRGLIRKISRYMQIAAFSLMLTEKDCHFISESWKERKKMRFSCQKALKYAWLRLNSHLGCFLRTCLSYRQHTICLAQSNKMWHRQDKSMLWQAQQVSLKIVFCVYNT